MCNRDPPCSGGHFGLSGAAARGAIDESRLVHCISTTAPYSGSDESVAPTMAVAETDGFSPLRASPCPRSTVIIWTSFKRSGSGTTRRSLLAGAKRASDERASRSLALVLCTSVTPTSAGPRIHAAAAVTPPTEVLRPDRGGRLRHRERTRNGTSARPSGSTRVAIHGYAA